MTTEDPLLPAALDEVHLTLQRLGMPPLRDMRGEKPIHSKSMVCCVLLSEPAYRFGHLLEGGRQSPGDIILCLSPTWVEQRQEKDHCDLYVKTGIYFDGMTVILADFVPRKVTYFANFLTYTGTEGARNDGVPLERDLICPMSQSVKLEKLTNDKLHTRLILNSLRVSVPLCLAFPFQSTRKYESPGSEITVIPISERTGNYELFKKSLLDFLKIVPSRIVIKPSGPSWMGSAGVRFFEADQVEQTLTYMEELLQKIHPEDSLLVDEFLFTMPSHFIRAYDELGLVNALSSTATVIQDPETLVEEVEALTDSSVIPFVQQSDSLNYRLRVNVCRTQKQFIVSKMICGVGPSNEPLHGENTFPQTFEDTLKQWGVSNREKVIETVRLEAVACHRALYQYEKTLSAEERGGVNAYSDYIGIDFILTVKGNVVVPAVIEINDHDSSSPAQQLEFYTGPTGLGKGVSPWVSHMLSSSQQFILSDKKILIVGAGGFSKKVVWENLSRMGVQVYVVDHDENHFAKSMVTQWIPVKGMNDHSKDEEHTETIRDLVKDLGISGCLTFWQDCAALSARVANRMGWVGNDWQNVLTAMSKSATLKKISSVKKFLAVTPTPALYAVKTVPITSVESLQTSAKSFIFPAVLKLDFGSSAVGVKLVSSPKEAVDVYTKFSNEFKEEVDHQGVGLSLGTGVTLMEYIQGSEHDIDIGVFQGRKIFAFVTDNGPTRLPLFTETSACMPTTLPSGKANTLIMAAMQILDALGLHTGVFNVEMKYTPSGPRLIEVNPRMGGFYIADWIQRVWGLNLVQQCIMISLGICPIIELPAQPLTHCVGLNLVASQNHGSTAQQLQVQIKRIEALGLAKLLWMEEKIPEKEEFEEPYANLSVSAASLKEAAGKLSLLLKSLNLDNGSVGVDYYIDNLLLNLTN